jgi:hypothetical protein
MTGAGASSIRLVIASERCIARRFTMARSARDALRYDAGPSIARAPERGLMHVTMTRAEEILAFTRSTMNGFAFQIQPLLDHDRCEGTVGKTAIAFRAPQQRAVLGCFQERGPRSQIRQLPHLFKHRHGYPTRDGPPIRLPFAPVGSRGGRSIAEDGATDPQANSRMATKP